jgi:hypothetical protein
MEVQILPIQIRWKYISSRIPPVAPNNPDLSRHPERSPVAASVAPLGRRISARIFAPLLPTRGAVALAVFFGLADLVVFLAVAALFFWVAAFFKADSIARNGGKCKREAKG